MTFIASLPPAEITPAPPRSAPPATFLALQPGRAHEICGPARRTGAGWIMGALPRDAAVIWMRLRWQADRLCPAGLTALACPAGLITLDAPSDADLLACAEDALRSGACALVVADLVTPPALTPLRRLHLAASEGQARAQGRGGNVCGLVLTPGDGGAAGVETRWHLSACPPAQDGTAAWQLERRRARMAPPAQWTIVMAG